MGARVVPIAAYSRERVLINARSLLSSCPPPRSLSLSLSLPNFHRRRPVARISPTRDSRSNYSHKLLIIITATTVISLAYHIHRRCQDHHEVTTTTQHHHNHHHDLTSVTTPPPSQPPPHHNNTATTIISTLQSPS